MRSERVWLATVAIIALIPSSLSAGGLNPPSAPRSTPGPEPRTPISAETTPGDDTAFFIITRPGSYYLTGNIRNALFNDPHDGIVIAASDVTVDLNGFTLDGFEPFVIPLDATPEPQGLAPRTTGILASGSIENVTIRNGTVRDWANGGINLENSQDGLVEGVVAINNGETGISVGDGTVISRCTARGSGLNGITTGIGCTVTECAARDNEGAGISAGAGGTVRGCSATSNGGNGIEGPLGEILITECAAFANQANGFSPGTGSVVQCTAYQNSESGIRLVGGIALENLCQATGVGILVIGSSSRIEGNNLIGNLRGIEAASGGNLIVRNRASGQFQNHYGFVDAANDLGTVQTTPVGAGPWDNFAD